MTLTTTEELKHLASSDNANELTRRLARECLANREAQPVAWRHDDGPFAGIAITRAKSVADSWIAKGWTVTPLYPAPPAPAVPDEIGAQEAKELFNYLMTEEELNATVNGYNACRAEMLAQPVSGAYKLPEGWIACSEQMPDDEQECLVQTHSGFRYVSFYDEHTGLFYDIPGGNQVDCVEHILVTHWMPLPAAPEGGNG